MLNESFNFLYIFLSSSFLLFLRNMYDNRIIFSEETFSFTLLLNFKDEDEEKSEIKEEETAI